MKVFAVAGNPEVAEVLMADMGGGRLIEFVEALQPPYTRDERWVLMVSTLYGCPVKCLICDAGGEYRGKLSAEEILSQIDYMVLRRYPDKRVPSGKFKIQFARMGEPAFNLAVLDVLEELPNRYLAPGLIPSISTIAPCGADAFFERLLDVKNHRYPHGRFQFQYSVHTTNVKLRDQLIPVHKWDFARMAAYGERFYCPGDRKITLNFALVSGMPVEPEVLLRYFDPASYLIKITPVNPTSQATRNGMASQVDITRPEAVQTIAAQLIDAGYQVIVSIGQVEENEIGSNCGQYVLNYLESGTPVKHGYSYQMESLVEAPLFLEGAKYARAKSKG
jgi:23S rRNA (adenine2503-C2)-methyltransferase